MHCFVITWHYSTRGNFFWDTLYMSVKKLGYNIILVTKILGKRDRKKAGCACLFCSAVFCGHKKILLYLILFGRHASIFSFYFQRSKFMSQFLSLVLSKVRQDVTVLNTSWAKAWKSVCVRKSYRERFIRFLRFFAWTCAVIKLRE